MAFNRFELANDPGVELFTINGFEYNFRMDDIISWSDVGKPYVEYKVESIKIEVNRVQSSGTSSVWGAATILVMVTEVP